MIYCQDCGSIFEEDEIESSREHIDGPYYQDIEVCPYCHSSNLDEAKQCEVCGDYFSPEDNEYGVCCHCLEEQMTVNNAIACGDDSAARTDLPINGFIAACFSQEEIDSILLKAFEKYIDSSDSNAVMVIEAAKDWCFEDTSFFADWLKQNLGGNQK